LFVSIKIRRSVDIIDIIGGPQRRNGMLGAGVEAKMEGCAMLPAIRLVSEAAEFAAHRHIGTTRKARPDSMRRSRRRDACFDDMGNWGLTCP
jgi:hypothetical protein